MTRGDAIALSKTALIAEARRVAVEYASRLAAEGMDHAEIVREVECYCHALAEWIRTSLSKIAADLAADRVLH